MSLWTQIQSWRYDQKPFPDSWRGILELEYPAYANLAGDDLTAFETHLKHFIWTKHWEGIRGLEVTEEMQVLIAAEAARIARQLPLEVYDNLTSIVIYANTFEHADGVATLGVAHRWGTVVLSWDAVRKGIAVPHDGNDTAIHEFAHVLDYEDGVADGTPLLDKGSDYSDWARVLGHYFCSLQHGGAIRKVMDSYGATNEAEFFAVATESFFERPVTLKRIAPELYAELQVFFRVDPATETQ